jgi:hypothetical protein
MHGLGLLVRSRRREPLRLPGVRAGSPCFLWPRAFFVWGPSVRSRSVARTSARIVPSAGKASAKGAWRLLRRGLAVRRSVFVSNLQNGALPRPLAGAQRVEAPGALPPRTSTRDPPISPAAGRPDESVAPAADSALAARAEFDSVVLHLPPALLRRTVVPVQAQRPSRQGPAPKRRGPRPVGGTSTKLKQTTAGRRKTSRIVVISPACPE